MAVLSFATSWADDYPIVAKVNGTAVGEDGIIATVTYSPDGGTLPEVKWYLADNDGHEVELTSANYQTSDNVWKYGPENPSAENVTNYTKVTTETNKYWIGISTVGNPVTINEVSVPVSQGYPLYYKSVYYIVNPKDITNDETITIGTIETQSYTGDDVEPALTVTGLTGDDYNVSYTDNTEVGTATATITGKGNYTGTKTANFDIKKSIADYATISPITDQTYTGKALEPEFTVTLNGDTSNDPNGDPATLTAGTDYTVTWANNTNAAQADAENAPTATITGIGDYAGTVSKTFTINQKNISENDVVASIEDQTYDANALTPAINITYGENSLALTTDYTVAWANNTNAAQATAENGAPTATLTGTGNYTGTKTVTFTINKAGATVEGYTITVGDVVYSGTGTSAAAIQKATMQDADSRVVSLTGHVVKYISNEDDGQGEVANPNHVGEWIMRVYVQDADANHEAGYASSTAFKVTPAQMQMNLGIINWVYGKDYPEVKKPYFNIPQSEYQPGDGENNVTIEEAGYVQPYEGLTDEFLPVGTGYKWSLQQGVQPKAVTTIANVKYENYTITANNNSAILNIAAAGLTVDVQKFSQSKVYGYEDPDFTPIVSNALNEAVASYTKNEDGDEVVTYTEAYAGADEEDAELTDDQKETIANELAELRNIYAALKVTREGGKGDSPRLEDVNIEEGYPFSVKITDATLAQSYAAVLVDNIGTFKIYPYNIADKYPVWATDKDGKYVYDENGNHVQATEADGTTLKYQPSKISVTITDKNYYNGQPQEPKPVVKFTHEVAEIGTLTLTDEEIEAKDDDPDTDADETVEFVPADYAIDSYANNTEVVRGTNDTRDPQYAASVTIKAHDANDNLNTNFYGTLTTNFRVKPAEVLIGFGDYQKTYGQSDSEAVDAAGKKLDYTNLANPIFTLMNPENRTQPLVDADGNAVAIYDDPLAEGFFQTKPVFSREAGEVVKANNGTYTIRVSNLPTAKNYNFTYAEGSLKINKATLSVSASPYVLVENADGTITESTDINWGDDILFHVYVNGYKNKTVGTTTLNIYDDNLLGEKGDTPTPEGTYGTISISSSNAGHFTITFGDDRTTELTNYTVVYSDQGNGNINPNADGLWIIAKNASKTYGESDKAEYFAWEATLDGEPITVAQLKEELGATDEQIAQIVVTRDKTRSNAGTYPLYFETVTDRWGQHVYPTKQNGEIDFDNIDSWSFPVTQIGNYTVNYQFGDFTIEKAHLRAKVKDVTNFKYGQKLDGKYDIEEYIPENGASGLIAGDNFDNVVNQSLQALGYKSVRQYLLDNDMYVCDYTVNPAVQDYQITVEPEAEWPEALNYIIAFNPGNLTVEKAPLTIAALPQNFVYNVDGVDGKAYITPAINEEIIDGETVEVTGEVPEGIDINDLVELSCEETAVGTHTDAIKITKKASDLIDVTIVDEDGNPYNADFTVTPLTEIHLSYENVAQALEDHKGYGAEEGEDMTVYLPNRELYADKWYTMVLPFKVRAAELARELFFATIEVLDESDASQNYKFVEVVNGDIEANQPFMIKLAAEKQSDAIAQTAENLEQVSFAGVTIGDGDFAYNDLENSPFVEDAAGNKFIGQYTGKTGLAAYEWAIATKPSSTNFGKFVTGGENAQNAYFPPTVAFLENANKSTDANIRIFVEENGVTTAINAVDGEIAAQDAEGWYTISGVKLNAKPTQKGVYIHNGKKVSVK